MYIIDNYSHEYKTRRILDFDKILLISIEMPCLFPLHFKFPKKDWKPSASLICDESLPNPQKPLPNPQEPEDLKSMYHPPLDADILSEDSFSIESEQELSNDIHVYHSQ